MSITPENLKVYARFARQHARRFLAERVKEARTSVPPAPHRPQPAEWSDERLTVAWLGHATTLINFYGTWLLTDPVLRSRIGVHLAGLTLGPRRLVRPALSVRELPALDAVLISHSHMDHCDLPTLKRLARQSHAVVQHGNLDLVRRFDHASDLAWGESVEVAGARIEAIEVNHWGARTLTDRHRGYGGFLIEKNGRALVFGGDTAYTNAFARLRPRVKVDLAILPIGAYDPWIYAHANPEQSWAMRREMGATYILPMHHSTFRLSREPTTEPITRLFKVAGDEDWRIALSEPGETWVMPEEERQQQNEKLHSLTA
ncbi:MAG TPA: MBL fold metallo-hydrolase [Pyrinomonadaceae bacterium]|nr:MBL fold metallo-hydrolase [Pyrinomonadaceae bacterium]